MNWRQSARQLLAHEAASLMRGRLPAVLDYELELVGAGGAVDAVHYMVAIFEQLGSLYRPLDRSDGATQEGGFDGLAHLQSAAPGAF